MPFSTIFWLFFPMVLIVILSIFTLFTGKENGTVHRKGVERSAD